MVIGLRAQVLNGQVKCSYSQADSCPSCHGKEPCETGALHGDRRAVWHHMLAFTCVPPVPAADGALPQDTL